jgi:hypothetical protein
MLPNHVARNKEMHTEFRSRNLKRLLGMPRDSRDGKGEVVPVLNQLSTTQLSRMLKWRCSSIILDLGNRCMSVVSFTP